MGFFKKLKKSVSRSISDVGKTVSNPGRVLGDLKTNAQNVAFRPYSTVGKALGMDNNEALKALDMFASPGSAVNVTEAVGSLLGSKESNDVLGSVTGTKDIQGKAMNKAMEDYKIGEQKAAVEGNLAVDQFKKIGDSLAGANNIFNPLTVKSTRSGKANTELDQLLKVFEARRSSIANRRAQPGISQTRLG